MTHYSRPQVIFEKLKSRHVLIFDVDHDEIQKKMKLFGFVSTKQKWRLKRHLSLEGYTFNLVPRELNLKNLKNNEKIEFNSFVKMSNQQWKNKQQY